MLDLDLLRSFVSVVESRGFTRAGERVHRTQSTVSQQIKRLEDDIGQVLLNRDGKDVTPTEAGERLLSYARRLLSLAEEARDVLAQPDHQGVVRLGIPEDFAAARLTKLLDSQQTKDGPAFVYCYIPLNPDERQAPNVVTMDHDPFIQS